MKSTKTKTKPAKSAKKPRIRYIAMKAGDVRVPGYQIRRKGERSWVNGTLPVIKIGQTCDSMFDYRRPAKPGEEGDV